MTRCPANLVTSDVLLAIEARRRLEQGRWPVGGGWLDQTAKCLEAIEMIERDEADWERERRRREEE